MPSCRRRPGIRQASPSGRWRFLSVANNHVLDFKAPGAVETIDVLGREGFAFAGAGVGPEAAAAPAFLQVPGGDTP